MWYIVTTDDGAQYAMPLAVVAQNRADFYKLFSPDTDDGTLERSLELFTEHPEDAISWALINMGWRKIAPHLKQIKEGSLTIETVWTTGEHSVQESVE